MEQTEEAAGRVVGLYAKSLARLAYTYLKNVPDAEDAVQDVLLKYLRAAPAFRGAEHEKAWLIRVTLNHCKNLLKRRRAERRQALPDGLGTMAAEESEVLRAVMSLEEKYRLPVHLHYYEGYAIREIAGILGEKPATVGTRLARARERLRGMIGGIEDA
jgi:RNA polymerase sigma-70 factor (ECF subfamily)